MRQDSAKAEQIQASGGESRRSSRLAMLMAELRNEYPVADRGRNRSNGYTDIARRRRGLARGRDVTGALCRYETKRTARRGGRRLPVGRRRDGLTGRKAKKDKAHAVWSRARRHAEPDARHRRLDDVRICDMDGKQAASRGAGERQADARKRGLA